ncbi:MAG: hypothetical protein HYZ27_11640, partial [Deltaproteobacteria bacterium]|nr:hypothetical protein [Deltaproteobacteria bacterium]
MRRGVLVLVCVVGCDVRSPGAVTGGPGGGNTPAVPAGLAIEAFATPLQVVAGGTAAVNCVVRQNGALVEGASTEVDVQPAPTSLTETDSAYSVRFNRVGLYALR